MTSFIRFCAATLIGSGLMASSATAGTEVLDSTAIGSIASLFGFSYVSPGFLASTSGIQELPQGPMGIGGVVVENRAYVTFDLSGLSGPVTGATLQLVTSSYVSQGPGGTFPNFTVESHPSEHFQVFDVSTPYASLQVPFINACGCFPPTPNADGLAAFADLGSGAVYGSFDASAGNVGVVIDIPLSAQAIADINAAGPNGFAVGIAFDGVPFQGLFGLFGAPLVQQTIDLAQANDDQRLILTTVPEPATWTLFAVGVVVVGAIRRRSGQATVASWLAASGRPSLRTTSASPSTSSRLDYPS